MKVKPRDHRRDPSLPSNNIALASSALLACVRVFVVQKSKALVALKVRIHHSSFTWTPNLGLLEMLV